MKQNTISNQIGNNPQNQTHTALKAGDKTSIMAFCNESARVLNVTGEA